MTALQWRYLQFTPLIHAEVDKITRTVAILRHLCTVAEPECLVIHVVQDGVVIEETVGDL